MKHIVKTTVINSQTGAPASSDGVMMMFIKAVAVSNTFVLDTAYLLSSVDDLATLGINAAYDIANNTAVYQQVTEYFAEATKNGDAAKLWLVGVAKATAFATYVASDTCKNDIRGTALINPANRAKMIGFCYDIPSDVQTGVDFPADVASTITAVQTLIDSLFNEHYEFSAIVDGYNMDSTANKWRTLSPASAKAKKSVSLCITGSQPNGVSSVGAALGRYARITVGTGLGEIVDDAGNEVPVLAQTAYLTNGVRRYLQTTDTMVVDKVYTVAGGDVTYNSATYHVGDSITCVTGYTSFTTTAGGYLIYSVAPKEVSKLMDVLDFQPLGDAQFMFLRTWFGHSGYFWNDGATCIDASMAINNQEQNRVINKLDADLVAFLIKLINKKIPVDVKTGNVDPGFLRLKEAEFIRDYITPLLPSGTGDISGASLNLAGPNFVSAKTITYDLKEVAAVLLGSAIGTIQSSVTL